MGLFGCNLGATGPLNIVCVLLCQKGAVRGSIHK